MTANDSKIKIMHVISRMNVGGPAVMIVDSIRMLDAHRFEQKLLAGECEPGEADYLQDQAKDIDATFVKGLGRKINIKGDLHALISIMREIKKYQPDIIHTHASKAGLLGRTAAILSRSDLKLVHTFHGHILSGYFGKYKTQVFVLLERILAKRTDVLVTVGIKVRDDLLLAKIGVLKKYKVIYPGVRVPEKFSKETARELLKIEVPVGNIVCAFFGRVTKIKRPDRFLEVVRESQLKSLPVSFFMAGDGDQSTLTRLSIEKSNLDVRWLGWQGNVGLVLSAADVLVITSDNEGLPLSAIEAGMTSLPVISTNVGSIKEIIVDGKTGFITERRVQDIVDKLKTLTEDLTLIPTLGTSAQIRVQSHFSSEQYIASLENLYFSI
jgi:glycosyltransferase involved in cell wall biosynthesis